MVVNNKVDSLSYDVEAPPPSAAGAGTGNPRARDAGRRRGVGAGAAQGVAAGAADDGEGAAAAPGRGVLPGRPAAPVQEPVVGAAPRAGAALLLPHLPVGVRLQPAPPALRPRRRPHHCQPRHPAGNQLRQARQPAANRWPIFQLRAAAHLRAAGELAGPGGGAGVHRVAGDGVHAPGRRVAGRAAAPLPAAGLHRHLLRRRLPGVPGIPQAGLHRGLPVQGDADGLHGRRRRHRVAAAAQGPARHLPLHLPHGIPRRHALRRQPPRRVEVADDRHGLRLPRHPPPHAPNQRQESKAFLGISRCSPGVGDHLHHPLLHLEIPQHQCYRHPPQGSEPSFGEHAQLQRLLRGADDQNRDHDRHPVLNRRDRSGQDLCVHQQLPGGREQGDDGDRADEHGGLLRLLLRDDGVLLPVGGELQRGLQDGVVQRRDGGGGAGDAAVPHAAVPLHPERDPGGDHHHGGGGAGGRARRRQAVEGGQAGLPGVRGGVPRRAAGVRADGPGRRRRHLALQGPAAGHPPQRRGGGPRPGDAELPQRGAVPRGRPRAGLPRRRRRVRRLLRQLHVPGGAGHALPPRRGGARAQVQPPLHPMRRPRHGRRRGDRHQRSRRAVRAQESPGQKKHRAGACQPGGVGGGEDVQLGGGRELRVGPPLLQRSGGRRGGGVQSGAALTTTTG
uniref:Sulfate transporter5 n=1 Tax=Zea mays TaxID=4577 RepID=A0A804R2G0_MAIZE